jgi:colanic acid/amylovoran biosynthesis glycosyltransferase
VDAHAFGPEERRDGEVGTAERPLRILSVGRMDWRKGYEYGLQAVRLLAARGVRCEYRIVGDGEYRGLVAFARYQLGLEGVVELLGSRGREEVRRELTWADVFLHAAVSEGFCNAVIEAQATALPVVCSDAGGLKENVAHGETGFVVPRRNPEALAEKLEALARDSTLRRSMGSAGHRRVQARFRVEDQLRSFERFYDEVLGTDSVATSAGEVKRVAAVGSGVSSGTA